MDQTRARWQSLSYISVGTYWRECLVGDLAPNKEIVAQLSELKESDSTLGIDD
jgi:hypothetical protein